MAKEPVYTTGWIGIYPYPKLAGYQIVRKTVKTNVCKKCNKVELEENSFVIGKILNRK